MTCDEIAELLRAHRFNFGHEIDLQEGISIALHDAGILFEREVNIGKGIIDFMVGDVGIEVKVGGSLAAVTRQLFRYAESDRIGSLVLVSSRTFHNSMPYQMNGKQLRCVGMIASAL